MIISACIIGLNDPARDFIAAFKAKSYYKQSDSDRLAARIHCIHVNNMLESAYDDVYHVTPDETVGKIVSLKDGEEETPRRIPFGSDPVWLAGEGAEGHRTVIEFIDKEPEKYIEVIRSQFKPGGYDFHITSESLLPYKEELEELAKSVNAKIYFYSGEDSVEKLLNYLDNKFEVGISKQGEPCGLDMETINWD